VIASCKGGARWAMGAAIPQNMIAPDSPNINMHCYIEAVL